MEEIVVTANRRNENLQRVPIAVTAITASAAAARGITGMEGLPEAVPGLDLSRQSNAATPFIRGIGSQTSQVGQEPSVATYVDGVYISAPPAGLFSFNNISRIEVLKGPQGTLFGRNATGGVIQIITRDPGPEPSVEATAGYGNYDTFEGSLYASTPLSENLAADIAVRGSYQGNGWGKNLNTGQDIFKAHDWSARSKLLFTPGNATRITLAGDYSRVRDEVGLNFHFFPGARGLDGVTTYNGFYNSYANPSDYSKIQQGGASLKVEQKLGAVRAVSITAYRALNGFYSYDQDATPLRIVAANIYEKVQTFTQELQLLSNTASKLEWIVGGFYLNDLSQYDPLTIAGAAVAPLPDLNIFSRQRTNSIAGFGQTRYEIAPDTHITGGLRYTSDERKLVGRNLATGIGQLGPTFETSKTFNKLTYRASVDHQFTPDLFGYLSYNRGFKSGVFNLLAFTDPPVKPEVLDAFETGFKAQFADGRVRLNGSAFYYKYSNIQVQEAVAGATRLLNAAKAKIKGFDLELTVQPIDGLTLNGALAYLHGRYNDFPAAPYNVPNPALTCPNGAPIPQPTPPGGNSVCTVNASGFTTVRTPVISGTIGGEYRVKTGSGDYAAALAASYKDSFFWDPDNRLRQPSYWLLNGSLSWATADQRLSVRLWGKNLLNEKYFSYAVAQAIGDGGSPAPPRTYGVTFGTKF